MTAPMDPGFDQLLRSVLEADGPQTVPDGLADAGVTRARTVSQRRPWLAALDGRGWPAARWTAWWVSAHRLGVVVIALLAAALLASVLVVGATRPPRPIGAGERIVVTASINGVRDHTAWIIADGSIRAYPIGSARAGGCEHLVGGTVTVARSAFGGREFVDLRDPDRVLAKIGTNYGGFEIWSPDARRLAQGDFSGRAAIVAFDDPAHPVARWFPAPGLSSAAWSADGSRLALARVVDATLHIDVIDAASLATVAMLTGPSGDLRNKAPGSPGPWILWESAGPRIFVVIDGDTSQRLLVADPLAGTLALVSSTALGTTGLGEKSWSPDGTRYAIADPSSLRIATDPAASPVVVATSSAPARLRWSPDSTRIAYVEAGRLTVASSDGSSRRGPQIDDAPFAWDLDASGLIVAQRSKQGAVIDRYRVGDLALEASVVAQGDPGDGPLCLQIDGPADRTP